MASVENQILGTVIQDHKKHIVLGTTIFGDIFFVDVDGEGKQLHSVFQIITF